MRGYVTSRGHAGVSFGIVGLLAYGFLALLRLLFIGAGLVILALVTLVVSLVKLAQQHHRQRHPKEAP